ncbi:MAG: pilus assembly protein TadG-related protein [Anaerolineae bacterium]
MLQYKVRNRGGQVLVTVALALLVLVGIVALAVDGGNVYAERRKMQNAADAGALAGARALCLENASSDEVEAVAQEYAIDLNGAHGAEVTIPGPFTVTVVTTETAGTFFARAIGFPEVEVAARASAMCQGPAAGGGLWPLAVGEDVYDETCPNPLKCIECGEMFYAYISDPTVTITDCNFALTTLGEAGGNIDCTINLGTLDADFDGLPDVAQVQHIDSSNRGWLDLQIPLDPYPSFCHENCGENNVACWIENGHPGPINPNDCVASKSGNMPALKDPVNGECDEVHNLLLFDGTCDGSPPPEEGVYYGCNDSLPPGEVFYHITGFGCMRVIGYYKAGFTCDKQNGTGTQVVNAQVVIVEKLCGFQDFNGDGVDDCTALVPGSGNPADIDEYIVIQLTE